MNSDKAKKLLLQHYSNLKFEVEYKEGKVNLVAKGVKFKSFDDDTRIEITFKDDGVATVTFVFDKLLPSLRNYELINQFNDNVGFLKAYITERNNNKFFCIESYVYECVTEENAVDTVVNMVKMLTTERTLKYLLPITTITD